MKILSEAKDQGSPLDEGSFVERAPVTLRFAQS